MVRPGVFTGKAVLDTLFVSLHYTPAMAGSQVHVQVVGEPDTAVQHVLDEFGVFLKNAVFSADVKPLLKEVCARVFGGASGLVDMMVSHFPSSRDGTPRKVRKAGVLAMIGRGVHGSRGRRGLQVEG